MSQLLLEPITLTGENEVSPSHSGLLSYLPGAVVISALGYFVDIYDLLLFSIVRVASLKSLGVGEQKLLSVGVSLINTQMVGMLLGGILWGILADKKGRLSVLFGSIFLYSLANIANGFATSVTQYAVFRFLAGVGLAGELGAAITLVSEVMSKEKRGYGTTLVASVGILGAVAAAMVGDVFTWRTAYMIGGVMGLGLLVLRVTMVESGMFESVSKSEVRKGDLRMLLGNGPRLIRYLCCILSGTPVWFVVGILLTFSPELAKELHVQGAITAGSAVLYGYLGLAIGDFATGFASQWVRSRKRVVFGALLSTAALTVVYVMADGISRQGFYGLCMVLGVASGYWCVFVTTAAEQFGTNLRGTVATTTPNFVRAAVVPLTLGFRALQGPLGLRGSALLIGGLCLALAFASLFGMEETYGKDLDYTES